MFRFQCTGCGQWHSGLPSYMTRAPALYTQANHEEQQSRFELTSDLCVMDAAVFFVLGLLEIPVQEADERLTYGLWCSLSRESFGQYLNAYEMDKRSQTGPYFGWLSNDALPFPSALNLKAMVHPRDVGFRPQIELEPTDHPLSVAQREGISLEKLKEVVAYHEQRWSGPEGRD